MTPNEAFTLWDSLKDILIALGIVSVPGTWIASSINHKYRMWEKDRDNKYEEEMAERKLVKETAISNAAEVKRIAEVHAAEVKRIAEEEALAARQERYENAQARTQENLMMMRFMFSTGELGHVTARALSGEKMNGEVKHAMDNYNVMRKEMDEYLMTQSAKKNHIEEKQT